MTLKTAALAPIPRASVRTTRELKPGRLSQVRRARRRSRSSGCPFLDSERTPPVVQLLGEPDFESVAAFTAVDRQPPGSSGFMKSETRRLTIEPDQRTGE